jgi:hypothetical protein
VACRSCKVGSPLVYSVSVCAPSDWFCVGCPAFTVNAFLIFPVPATCPDDLMALMCDEFCKSEVPNCAVLFSVLKYFPSSKSEPLCSNPLLLDMKLRHWVSGWDLRTLQYESSTFLRNVGSRLASDSVSYLRGTNSSIASLRKSQNSLCVQKLLTYKCFAVGCCPLPPKPQPPNWMTTLPALLSLQFSMYEIFPAPETWDAAVPRGSNVASQLLALY